MDKTEVIDAFGALAQPTRLDAFRFLVMHEPEGLPVGDIARGLGVPHNTLSTHLAILARAGLVKSERRSRLVVYRADLDAVQGLASFLLKDCCAGHHPEVAAAFAATASSCGAAPKRGDRS
ncbi:MAG: transcriptional regulator [Leifsonia xyli]|nr:MAG: transcriptional regulator [Leifsonia xyli]